MLLEGLRPNTRYAVAASAVDIAGRPSDAGPAAVLVSLPAPPGRPTVSAAQATAAAAAGPAASGRQDSILGYNVTAIALPLTAAADAAPVGPPLYQLSPGPGTGCSVTGLQPGTRYVFAVAAINAAGQSAFGPASASFVTQVPRPPCQAIPCPDIPQP